MKEVPKDLRFYELGPLEVTVKDKPVPLGGPKPRALLSALLVGNRRTVTVDRLVDVLWGEKPPPTAVKTIQKYVSQLRVHLGGCLLTRPSGYLLEVGDNQVDAYRFAGLIAKGGMTKSTEAALLLEEALALWRGLPFAELEDDDLALAERARLEELRMTAIETLFQLRLEDGQHHSVIGALEEHVRLYPLRERLWGQLMLAYYRSSRQSEALRAYRRLASILGEELGLEPSPELRALEERILLHDPSLLATSFTPAQRTNLRPRLNKFIGRVEELAELSELLQGARLLTVTGPAGSGKTRLAVELAERQLSEFRDGVWLIDLAPVVSPDQVADAMAKPFGVGGSGDRPTLLLLTDYLRDLLALLVIDNCEHLAAKVAAVALEMLEVSPGIRIVATSRERLGIPGEVNFPLSPLPCPEEGGEIETVDAVALFGDRARAAAPQFEVGSENRLAVAEICRRLDGIPLAIELAAARVTSFSPRDLAAHLDRRLMVLGSANTAAVARHRTLRAAIDWSYNLLSREEQTLFRRLSVFRGGFDLEATTRICAYEPLEVDLVLTTLPQLVDKSLITVDRLPGGATRYRLLEMLREYGQDQLEVSEVGVLRDFHASHFATMAAAAATGLRGHEQREWIRRLSVEHDNLRKALRWADGQSPELVVRMAVALARFWDAVGPRAEGHQWLRRAVELSDSMGSDAKVMARVAASDVFSSMRSTHSRNYAEEALIEARQAGDVVGEAQAQRALCWALALEERPDESLQAGLAALATFERLEDHWEQAFCLERLGQADYRDPVASTKRLRQARILYAQVGDRTREAVVLYKLAGLDAQGGDFARAVAQAEMSVAMSRELGSAHDEAHALHEYGKIVVRAGEPARGLAILEQALEGLTKTGDERCSVRTLAVMGSALLQIGDAPKADHVLSETLQRAAEVDDLQSIRIAAAGIAQLLHQEGQVAKAVQLYGFVNSLTREGGLPLTLGRRQKREDVIEELRSQLNKNEFASAWRQGQAMTIADARALVRDERLVGEPI
ncbi:MAG: BTAD domain-containing putative transcriptional regulator [Acidimicrobiia bacterium]